MGLNFSTGNTTQKYTSNVAYVHFFSDATRNIVNNSTSSRVQIETTFNKKYADTNNLSDKFIAWHKNYNHYDYQLYQEFSA